jgi:hypothetical protein
MNLNSTLLVLGISHLLLQPLKALIGCVIVLLEIAKNVPVGLFSYLGIKFVQVLLIHRSDCD